MHVWVACAAVHGVIAVAIGAFAAHGLEASFGAARLEWLETGARYQIFHALALLAVAALGPTGVFDGRFAQLGLVVVGTAFTLGATLFAGGLYLAALLDWIWLLPVVPVGGGAFLIGWAALGCLAVAGRASGARRR